MLLYQDVQYAQIVLEYLDGVDDFDYEYIFHDAPGSYTAVKDFLDWLEIQVDSSNQFTFMQYHLGEFHPTVRYLVLTDARRRSVARDVGDYLEINYDVFDWIPADLYDVTEAADLENLRGHFLHYMNQTRGPAEDSSIYYDDNLSMPGDP